MTEQTLRRIQAAIVVFAFLFLAGIAIVGVCAQ